MLVLGGRFYSLFYRRRNRVREGLEPQGHSKEWGQDLDSGESESRKELENEFMVLMGGRAGEGIVREFGYEQS